MKAFRSFYLSILSNASNADGGFSLQNDEVAKKQSELRQQKAVAAEEERRRMNLLNALSRDHTTTNHDSESFCT